MLELLESFQRPNTMNFNRNLFLIFTIFVTLHGGFYACKSRSISNQLAAVDDEEESDLVFSSYPLDETDLKRIPFAFKAIEDALAQFAASGEYPPFDVRERAQSLASEGSTADWNTLFNKIENPIQDRLANLTYEAQALPSYAAWYKTSIPTIERVLQYYNLKQDVAAHRLNLASGQGLRVISAMFRERRNHANQDLIDYFQINIPQMDISRMARDMKSKYPDIRSEADVYRKVESLELSYSVIWRTALPADRIENIQNLAQSVLNVTLPHLADSYLTIANRLIDLTNDPERIIQNARNVIGVDPDALRNILHFTGRYLKKTDMSDAQIDMIIEMRKREKPATIAEIALAIGETEGAVRGRVDRLIQEGRLVKLKEIESGLKLDINLIDTQKPKRFEDTRFSELRKNGEWDQDKFYDYLLTFGDQTLEWQAEQLGCEPSTIRAWRVRFGIYDPAAKKRFAKDPAPQLKITSTPEKDSFEQAKARLSATFNSASEVKFKRQKIILEMYLLLFERKVSRDPATQRLENIPTVITLAGEFEVSKALITHKTHGAFSSPRQANESFYSYVLASFARHNDGYTLLNDHPYDLLFHDFKFAIPKGETNFIMDNERKLLQKRTLDQAFKNIEMDLEVPMFNCFNVSTILNVSKNQMSGNGAYGPEFSYGRRIFDGMDDFDNNVAKRFAFIVSHLETKFIGLRFGQKDVIKLKQLLVAIPFLGKGNKSGSEIALSNNKESVRKILIMLSTLLTTKDLGFQKDVSVALKISEAKLFSRDTYKKNGAYYGHGVFESGSEYFDLLTKKAISVAGALHNLKSSGVQLTPFQESLLTSASEISLSLKSNSSPATETPDAKDVPLENLDSSPETSKIPCENVKDNLNRK